MHRLCTRNTQKCYQRYVTSKLTPEHLFALPFFTDRAKTQSAKGTFAVGIASHPQCHTVFLLVCFSAAKNTVISINQLKCFPAFSLSTKSKQITQDHVSESSTASFEIFSSWLQTGKLEHTMSPMRGWPRKTEYN